MLEKAKTVAVCDSQPIVIQGIEALLSGRDDLCVIGGVTSLPCGMQMVLEHHPDLLLVDRRLGFHGVLDLVMTQLAGGSSVAVVWGDAWNEAEVMRLVNAGVKGVFRKTAALNTILDCFHTVLQGGTWVEQPAPELPQLLSRAALTPRQRQIVELVEEGMKNKDIAKALGICPGTVKIHLRHIFERTGLRGRYGLALSGLREKGLLSAPV